ncbi:MAG: D-alanyl-D-alanine carboxypeptidase [Patescibacteria group bacterium]|nr:D-alanyl-D-alanine carboxypeptidase [Patescibacteria group bacterium]MDE2172799.1 D-alanyl-D-alanine carboxypeptidase [Patescibacteria group bacterium]
MIVLSVIAVAVVALALAYRIGLALPYQAVRSVESASGQSLHAPVRVEQSFYNDSVASDTNAEAQPQPNPSSSPQPHNPAATVPHAPILGPVISAQSYLVGNVATGRIYLEKNDTEVLPVASMSKLITAFVATETLPPSQPVTITDAEMNTATDTSHLAVGETFTASELLYPMLLNSSNVAAEALASTSDRTKFLELMSSYAWEIGMPATFFADPSGVSPRNISTAVDFFNLAKYLYSSRPDILAITRTVSQRVATTSEHLGHTFDSIHPFVTDPRFIGGKTGHTPEARDTMLTILNIGGQPIAFIVLSSEDRRADTDMLIEMYSKKS